MQLLVWECSRMCWLGLTNGPMVFNCETMFLLLFLKKCWVLGMIYLWWNNSCDWVPFFEVGPNDSKATLIICNHSSPSLVKTTIAACVWKLLGHMVTTNAESTMGIFLSPTFAYTKGSLFSEEYAILKTLANSGCYVDGVFQVNFEGKSKTELCPKISSCLLS